MPGMSRRSAAGWLLMLPLMVAGSQLAHVIAYRLVYPEAHLRLRELLATGHSYMGYMPLVLGIGAALELVAFGSLVVDGVRRRRRVILSPWAFALLPPLGFVLQEFLERRLAGASFPWWMVLQPTFRIGLLLQLPFALAAFLIARLLSRVADRVASVLRARSQRPLRVGLRARWVAAVAWLPRPGVLADGHAGRGPPFAAGPATIAL
jgi:hypothetical protein